MNNVKPKIVLLLIIGCLLFLSIHIYALDEYEPADDFGQYYKEIIVLNKIEGYQTQISVFKSSGGDVSCDGHCNDNFSDLRFVSSNGTLIPYYISNYINGISASVTVNNIYNDTTLFMWYGNVSATDISDAEGVYPTYYENWETNTTSEWTGRNWGSNQYGYSLDSINDINGKKLTIYGLYSSWIYGSWDYSYIMFTDSVSISPTSTTDSVGIRLCHRTSFVPTTDNVYFQLFIRTNGITYTTNWSGFSKVGYLNDDLEIGINHSSSEASYYVIDVASGNVLISDILTTDITDPSNTPYLVWGGLSAAGMDFIYLGSSNKVRLRNPAGNGGVDLDVDEWYISRYEDIEPTFSLSGVNVDDNANPSWYDSTHVKTIQEGVNNASEGDTIYVWEGTYVESVTINKTINLIGNSSTSTTINCGGGDNNINVESDYVNISGFKIQNGKVGIDVNANYTTISNNIIIDAGNDGIHLNASSNNTVENNIITNCEFGLEIFESHYNNVISNNITNCNGAYGISVEDSNSSIIYNNYFNNTQNAYDNGYNNKWNTTKQLGTNIIGGLYLGGNHWSDYTGMDTNGDGLGDTNLPYNNGGEIMSGGDYLPLVATNHTSPVRDAFYFDWLSTNSSGDVYQRYFDGTYLYVAMGDNGLYAYYLNTSTYELEFIAAIDNGDTYRGCWGDGSYIYCGRIASGLSAYSFNGTAFTLLDTDSSSYQYQVCGVDGYIFTAGGSSTGHKCRAFTFNGVAFTKVDEWTDANGGTHISVEKSGFDYYVYTCNYLPFHAGLHAYVFNGTGFESEVEFDNGAGSGLYALNGYVFYTQWEGDLRVFTFDGTGFTHLATYNPPVGSSIGCTWATDGVENTTYVFYGASGVMECVLWNNTDFELLDRTNVSCGGYIRGDIFGYGSFDYPNSGLLFSGWNTLVVMSGYGTKFTNNEITVAQGMSSSWYNYNNTVPSLENAMNNIKDGGTITIWNGTYPSWGYSKYQMSDGTKPRVNIANLTIYGNGSDSYISSELLIQSENTTLTNMHLRALTCYDEYLVVQDSYISGTIRLESSSNYAWINNSIISGYTYLNVGIRIVGGSFINISNNYITLPYSSSNVYSIKIGSDNVTIYNNTLYETGAFGIDVTSKDVAIKNNIIKGGAYSTYWGLGINICDAENVLICDNYIFNYTAADDSDDDYDNGIRFDGNAAENITIRDNYIYDCDNAGVFIDDGGSWFNIINNTIWDTDSGFTFTGAGSKRRINLTNNVGYNLTGNAIYFRYSYTESMPSNISNNYFYNVSGHGIRTYCFNYVTIYNNTLIGNSSDSGTAVRFEQSNNNIMKNNIFVNFSKGILMSSYSVDNLIYNNYIDVNSIFSYVDSTSMGNTWNVSKISGNNIIGGPYIMGNYWANYTGTDSDGDGIGDTPYAIGIDHPV